MRCTHSPLVTGKPFIRAYAGVPVTALAGQRVEMACILDRKPGQCDPIELAILGVLRNAVNADLAQQPNESSGSGDSGALPIAIGCKRP